MLITLRGQCFKQLLNIDNQMMILSYQEKLKGSLPLAAIDAVEKLREINNSLKITGPFKHPLILQASGIKECQEWIEAIENGKTTLKNIADFIWPCQ